MKKLSKIFTILMTLMIILSATVLPMSVNAATNPYPKSQTISGITTIPCTYYAWQQAYDKLGVAMPNWGNAVNWYNGAKNSGYSVGSTAKPNSIAVWSGGTYGHVSYVVSVNGSKMTVNEGGMHSNGGAYNGNGIYNGNVVNSIVGQQKGNGSTKILVGFVYLTGNSSSSVTLAYDAGKSENYSNNAKVWYNINKPSSWTVTGIGIKIRKEGSSYSEGFEHLQATEGGNHSGKTVVSVSWDFKDELGFTPTHLTKYYFKFYAKVNGTDYWSSEYSISTVGSHSYGSWSTTKAATCTATGTQTRKCSGCSKTESKTISALGHSYSSSYTVDKAATCTTAGSKSKHCSRCSATTSVTSISATGHSYGAWSVTKAATCTEKGTKVRKCTKCSASETQNIAALGHDYNSSWTTDVKATCTKAGTKSQHCSRCNARDDITSIKALGHSFGSWSVTKEATVDSTGEKVRKCTRSGCSAKETATIAKLTEDGHIHNFGEWEIENDATCTESGIMMRKCDSCGEKESQQITPIGHIFGEWETVEETTNTEDGKLERVCSSCGQRETMTASQFFEDDSKNTAVGKQNAKTTESEDLKIKYILFGAGGSIVLAGLILLLNVLLKKKRM